MRAALSWFSAPLHWQELKVSSLQFLWGFFFILYYSRADLMTRKYYSSTLSWGPVKSLPSRAKLALKVGYKNWFRTNCSGGYCSQTVNNICLQVLTRLEQNLFMVLISFFLGNKEKVSSSENTYIFFWRTLCFILQVLSSLGSAPTLLNMLAALKPGLFWSPDIVFEAPLGYFCSSHVAPSLFHWKIQSIYAVLCSSFSICPFFFWLCFILQHSWTPCGNPLITNNC